MFFYMLGRLVFGAFVGWLTATLLNKITAKYNNYRHERRVTFVRKHIDKTIDDILSN